MSHHKKAQSLHVPTTYAIRHVTRFIYSDVVTESIMEVRMRPSNEGAQRCLQFELDVQPQARVFSYLDALGNYVQHFDIPGSHRDLTIIARARVQIAHPDPLPHSIALDSWQAVDEWAARDEHWDFVHASAFAAWTNPLLAFVESLGPVARREADPLTTVRETMAAIHREFEYSPDTTTVESTIDEALAARRGVCQDFTHLMLATLRRVGLPCRYVSGYLAPPSFADNSHPTTIATHAWVEVLLPEIGWIGVDPTNNIAAGVRHIRVAIGRDYADVPPTRGVFKGQTTSTLSVNVEVTPGSSWPALDRPMETSACVVKTASPSSQARDRLMQQQQQQQQ
jgi:transglutaminase-like putative cysteine protease